MPTIVIDGPYITQSDINDTVTAFTRLRADRGDNILHLRAAQLLKDIDLRLIGYFILFVDELKGLNITLELPHNTQGTDIGLEFKIKLVGIYAYLMTGKTVFSVTFGTEPFSFDYSKAKKFPDKMFVLSSSFIISLLVSKNEQSILDTLFEKKFSQSASRPLYEGVTGVIWQENNDSLYAAFYDKIIEDLTPGDRESCIVDLGRIAFFSACLQAKLLSIYTDKDYKLDNTVKKEKMRAGNLTMHDAYEYYDRVSSIFFELGELPLVYTFIFSTLISAGFVPSQLIKETKEDFVNDMYILWDFTRDLVYGIRELVKNIHEHSTEKAGIVVCRILSEEKFRELSRIEELNDALYSDYLKYLVQKNVKSKAFLDIHVFDLGIKGIIPTLSKNTEDLHKGMSSDDPLKKILEEDIEILNDGQTKLGDLLDSERGSFLNQQSKRSIAHFGLLTFSRLIVKNNGLLMATSRDIAGNPETVTLPGISPGKHWGIMNGASYRIILPVTSARKYDLHFPHAIKLPADTSVAEILGLESLFDFSYIDLTKGPSEKPGLKNILGLKFQASKLSDREDEAVLWRSCGLAMKKARADTLNPAEFIIHLDFELVSINASQLLRFFGRFETDYPKISLIVSNITTEAYLDLTKINESFVTRNPLLDYWNKHTPVVVYSYITDSENDRFYFTDTLWGRTGPDFINLNQLIQLNQFNAIAQVNKYKGAIPADSAIHITNSAAFFNRNRLLPFELLLKAGNGLTLFENNAVMLLKNPIIP